MRGAVSERQDVFTSFSADSPVFIFTQPQVAECVAPTNCWYENTHNDITL